MVAIRSRTTAWWLGKSPAERMSTVWLLAAIVGYLVHYVVFFCWIQPFYIEDSAISFAYARNIVEGLGAVPYPGGERVEGYSNALWTFLIAGMYAVGVSVWTSSKLLGGIFGCITLGYAWGIARRALPPEERYAPYALFAPILLAASTQFVLWNSSGLENSLFGLCLSAGIYSLVRELEEGRRFPLSALWFLGLTMTRPDGLAYAGIALFARVVSGVWRRQWGATLAWIVVLGVPWAAYNAARYEYFAYPWPNTYYAKDKDFKPFNWTQLGWKQIKEYFWIYGIVWTVPAMAVGMVGARRWRVVPILVWCAIVAFMLAWDGREYIPPALKSDTTAWLSQYWVNIRVYSIVLFAAVVGLGVFGRKGWEARGLLWASYGFGLFFIVFSSGDWMLSYRWFSLSSVPQFVRIAVGLGVVAEALPGANRRLRNKIPMGIVYAAVPTLALIGANVPRTNEFLTRPETQPRDVHRRVEFMRWVQTRLDLDRVTLMDVDMGAHMWYTDWGIVDMAGLIDVPIAHHKYQKAMMTEYIFEERRPEFAHVHGNWANTTRIPRIDRWKDEYIEIPGYPSGKRALHIGNHIRRDLLAGDRWDGPPGRQVRFADRVRMEGWDLPAPTVSAGGELQIDSAWRVSDRKDGFRVVLFLAQGDTVAWSGEVTPGYDWVPVEEWGALDYVKGNWSVLMPTGLKEGTYDLGFVVLDEKSGVVLPFEGLGIGDQGFVGDATATPVDPGPSPAPAAPAFAVGEYRLTGAVTIVKAAEAVAAADQVAATAIAAAEQGRCKEADRLWRAARHHVARNVSWIDGANVRVLAARVGCRLAKLAEAEDDEARSRLIGEARWLDPRSAAVNEAGAPVGARLMEAGEAAFTAEKWDAAYRAFSGAVRADPSLAWARRKAEEARDKRLGIVDPKGNDTTAVAPAKKPAPKKPAVKSGKATTTPKPLPAAKPVDAD